MTDRKFALKLLVTLAMATGAAAENSSEFQLNNPICGYFRKMPFELNAGYFLASA